MGTALPRAPCDRGGDDDPDNSEWHRKSAAATDDPQVEWPWRDSNSTGWAAGGVVAAIPPAAFCPVRLELTVVPLNGSGAASGVSLCGHGGHVARVSRTDAAAAAGVHRGHALFPLRSPALHPGDGVDVVSAGGGHGEADGGHQYAGVGLQSEHAHHRHAGHHGRLPLPDALGDGRGGAGGVQRVRHGGVLPVCHIQHIRDALPADDMEGAQRARQQWPRCRRRLGCDAPRAVAALLPLLRRPAAGRAGHLPTAELSVRTAAADARLLGAAGRAQCGAGCAPLAAAAVRVADQRHAPLPPAIFPALPGQLSAPTPAAAAGGHSIRLVRIASAAAGEPAQVRRPLVHPQALLARQVRLLSTVRRARLDRLRHLHERPGAVAGVRRADGGALRPRLPHRVLAAVDGNQDGVSDLSSRPAIPINRKSVGGRQRADRARCRVGGGASSRARSEKRARIGGSDRGREGERTRKGENAIVAHTHARKSVH
eukprot:ctg_2475.g500